MRGLPSKLRLHAGFLLDPEGELKLRGRSLHKEFDQAGYGALHKRIERALTVLSSGDESSIESRKALERLAAAIDRVPTPADVTPGSVTFMSGLKKAMRGGPAAVEGVPHVGLWEARRLGLESADMSALSRAVLDDWVRLERHAYPVVRRAEGRRLTLDWSHGFAADSQLRPYWSDSALELLRATEDVASVEAVNACASALVEVLLSQVALIQVGADGEDLELEGLLQSTERSGRRAISCRPGGVFIDRLKQWLGLETLEELHGLDDRDPPAFHVSTLKAWSSGSSFPTEDKVTQFLNYVRRQESGAIDPNWERIGATYWAAQRLDALHRTFGRYWSIVGPMLGPEANICEWCRRRYPHWIIHWKQQAGEKALIARV